MNPCYMYLGCPPSIIGIIAINSWHRNFFTADSLNNHRGKINYREKETIKYKMRNAKSNLSRGMLGYDCLLCVSAHLQIEPNI
jgi:hypothetical protein